MTAPIVVYRPKLIWQPVDGTGAEAGSPVDISCDMSSVELGVDTPTTDVTTFCGSFEIPGDIQVSATLEVVVSDDTDARWSPLVGDQGYLHLYDRTSDTDYRRFLTQIPLNPSLYGPDTPGEARSFSFDVPVLSAVEWVTGA